MSFFICYRSWEDVSWVWEVWEFGLMMKTFDCALFLCCWRSVLPLVLIIYVFLLAWPLIFLVVSWPIWRNFWTDFCIWFICMGSFRNKIRSFLGTSSSLIFHLDVKQVWNNARIHWSGLRQTTILLVVSACNSSIEHFISPTISHSFWKSGKGRDMSLTILDSDF